MSVEAARATDEGVGDLPLDEVRGDRPRLRNSSVRCWIEGLEVRPKEDSSGASTEAFPTPALSLAVAVDLDVEASATSVPPMGSCKDCWSEQEQE